MVIGSGPNGLVAAALLARAGWRVVVLERSAVAGGSIRTEELTAPGYLHDTSSAFYGVLHSTPVFKELELDKRVTWAHPEVAVSAMISPEKGALGYMSPKETAAGLERFALSDGPAWTELCEWWDSAGKRLFETLTNPLPPVASGLRFLRAARMRGALDTTKMMLEPIEVVARKRFQSEEARALFASAASHADLGVDVGGSTPTALILAMVAQQRGMPFPVGGAGRLAEALVGVVEEAGGSVLTNKEVTDVRIERGRAVGVKTRDGASFEARRAVIGDTGPLALFRDMVGEDHVPASYLDGLRQYRYGSGFFRIDLALRGGTPWIADGLDRCGVTHLVGDLDSMARSAFETSRGRIPAEPMVIVGQQSIADPSRAPEGGHALWIETHVPSLPRGDEAGVLAAGPWAGSSDGFVERVLDRLESYAPGLRSQIVGIAKRTPTELEADNPNLVGGDPGGGSTALDQQLIFRPVPGWFRYATPVKGLYLCSAATHPGGGVHGMGGRNCAQRVLRDSRMRRPF